MIELNGHLSKMKTELNGNKATYSLVLDDETHNISQYIEDDKNIQITLQYSNVIHCIHCARKINKTFNQGYCFPCFRSLAQCDSCIMSPEKCHFHLGTCREPEWGEENCMRSHYVYIANSSGLKVGLTRASQVPTRWIDQGAIAALLIAKVATRYQAGLLETICKEFLNDKTNWRAMLKNDVTYLDLANERSKLYTQIEEPLSDLQMQFNNNQICWQEDENEVEICYPVKHYPTKVTSLSLDKTDTIKGILQGIKGQYLILDSGVINLRKHTGYQVKISLEEIV